MDGTGTTPADDDTDSDAWDIRILLLNTAEGSEEVKLQGDLERQIRRRAEFWVRWRRRGNRTVALLSVLTIVYATVLIVVALGGRESDFSGDMLIAGGLALFMTLTAAVAIHIISRGQHILHAGFDHAALIVSQLNAQRVKRVILDVNDQIARVYGELARRGGEIDGLNRALDDLREAVRAATHHFLADGDREAVRILKETEDLLTGDRTRTSGQEKTSHAKVMPLPPRRPR